MQTIKIINDNVKKISDTNTLLDMLLEFEGVVDSFDLYAYKNWDKGEVIKGPKLGRYFVEVALMYKHKNMPDPEGLLRLKENDCEAKMYKDNLVTSRRVKGVEDTTVIQRGNTPRRVAKTQDNPIWIIEIKMPRRYVDEFSREQVEAAEDSYIDMEAMASAQDQSLEQPNINPDPNMPMPGMEQPLL